MPTQLPTFENRFVNNLPADHIEENYCRSVASAAYSFVSPTKSASPSLVAVSDVLLEQLGLSFLQENDDQFAQLMTGNKLFHGTLPYALCYGGHQFGQWAGQLGDGRAINLGELNTQQLGYQTLQLKGAGKTPYSRRGDGLAVLRSSIREFICSEAMFHLGVPTTRALSLCLTGDKVMRDIMYDGNAAMEPGAIVCRVSASFLRFGNFQLPASRGDEELLAKLVQYSITSDFNHLLNYQGFSTEIYLAWFKEIATRSCDMVIHWMRIGFVHGVMNTDNMSIIGETIDYGPYGWIDNFDLNWTPNSSDEHQKRYSFGQQSKIVQWNLFQLANAIFPLIGEAEPLQAILSDYATEYHNKWCHMMAKKLGLIAYQGQADLSLFKDLENLLSLVETDMTIFYRCLATIPMDINLTSPQVLQTIFSSCFYNQEEISERYMLTLHAWLTRYISRIKYDLLSDEQRATAMNKVNPNYVPRNYLLQQAIELAEQGDFSELFKLQQIFKSPYQEQSGFEEYAAKRPNWAKTKIGCSTLSCSS